MKYNYNEILEPWYPEEFLPITMEPIKKNTYIISNYGRVINIVSGTELKGFISGGYHKIFLKSEDDRLYTTAIHRLVAYHFIPKTYDDIVNDRDFVNHKNMIGTCNYVHNLEWVNRSENAMHSHQYRYLLLKNPVERLKEPHFDSRGSKNHMARVNEEQVHTMCKMLEEGYGYKDICNAVGLEGNENDRHLLTNLVRGVRWKHIASQYNLPKPKQSTDFSRYVIPVCELLEQGLSNKEIVKILEMDTPGDSSYRFINRLRNRKIYSDITKNYNF